MFNDKETLAYSIKSGSIAAGVGQTKMREEINAGNLKAKKLGKRTIITADDLREWLNSLPAMREAK